MFKPFKPPSFIRRPSGNSSTASDSLPKRQRISSDAANVVKTEAASSPSSDEVVFVSSAPKTFRQPLKINQNVSNTTSTPPTGAGVAYYNVLWRKPTTKKNKTWDGDGILRVSEGNAFLQDTGGGKTLGKGPCNGPLLPGSSLKLGGKEVEVESLLSREELQAIRSGSGGSSSPPQPRHSSDGASSQTEATHKQQTRQPVRKRPDEKTPTGLLLKENSRKPASSKSTSNVDKSDLKKRQIAESPRDSVSAVPTSLASKGWKNPLKEDTVLPQGADNEPTPRHDPKSPEALVMRKLPARDVPRGRRAVDVVVDPLLARKLRPHQREGVKFLYDCVMGMRSKLGQGAILADDMGLGKTLQTIALIWTLLKQNPVYGDEPVIRKALIVCPVTLTRNWRKEFRKWLGNEKIGVFMAGDKNTRITDFTRGRSYSVMIIGYERLRTVYEELQKGQGIDLIIADEGHRLKTTQSKLAQAVQTLSTPRRIILSGTPIQNDLGEFFSMVDFVNPGALGTLKAFTRNFETPIEKSRQPGALEKDVEKGEARSEELAETTGAFILRRTADVLSEYLPSKTESVLLCRPTAAQASVYRHVLASPVFQSALGSAESALQLITILKKVCNSPKLLSIDPTVDPETATLAPAVAASIPPHLIRNASASSKLRVLDQLLHQIHNRTNEKVVIVSNFTSTLDMLGSLLTSLSLTFLRLDGSTPSSKRQDLVDTFNRSERSTCFAFLLSAKAGGVGLNLVGASRLVLFDVDWNPAVDAQAMARIHRDGQRRPCHIYRLLVAGALDEKIWQRQVTKLGLASSVLDSSSSTSSTRPSGQSSFTREELRDLFRLDESLACQTHELIGCKCRGRRSLQDVALAQESIVGSLLPRPPSSPSTRSSVEIVEESGRPVSEDTDSDLDLMPVRSKRTKKPPADFGLPRVVKASEVDMDAQEQQLQDAMAKRRDGESVSLESLMAYSHVDTWSLSQSEEMETLIQDDLLREVIRDEDNLVSFVFSKTNG